MHACMLNAKHCTKWFNHNQSDQIADFFSLTQAKIEENV